MQGFKYNKILVRTPNWLGDLVMSHAFFKQLQLQFPQAEIHAIAKENLTGLMPLFTMVKKHVVFDKNKYKGLFGLRKFAKQLNENYDYFFCLPDSFSSAFMGRFVKADLRIGYKNELRTFLLNESFAIPQNIHRVDKYVKLLELLGHKLGESNSTLFDVDLAQSTFFEKEKGVKNIAFNPMAVGLGRSFSVEQSCSIIKKINKQETAQFYVIGTAAANEHAQQIQKKLGNISIKNLCGKTNLIELATLLQQVDLLVTTDSGPAHLANALATPVSVYFSTGVVDETAPYHKAQLQILNYSDIKL